MSAAYLRNVPMSFRLVMGFKRKEEVIMFSAKSMTRRHFVGHRASAGAAAAWAGEAMVSSAAEVNAEKSGQVPDRFQIGAASKVITPELGTWVQAAGVTKRGTQIR